VSLSEVDLLFRTGLRLVAKMHLVRFHAAFRVSANPAKVDQELRFVRTQVQNLGSFEPTG